MKVSDTLQEPLIKRLRRVVRVCLEVGTAQRYTVGHTIHKNDNALIIHAVRFGQVARWTVPTSKRTLLLRVEGT